MAYMFLGMFLESVAIPMLAGPVVILIAIGLDWRLIWCAMAVMTGRLVLFPQIALFLPQTIVGG